MSNKVSEGRTIKISNEVYVQLLKLKASLTATNGKSRTFDDILRELLKEK